MKYIIEHNRKGAWVPSCFMTEAYESYDGALAGLKAQIDSKYWNDYKVTGLWCSDYDYAQLPVPTPDYYDPNVWEDDPENGVDDSGDDPYIIYRDF
jgi:hypothetical protein